LLTHNGKHFERVARIACRNNQVFVSGMLADQPLRVSGIGAPAHGSIDERPVGQMWKTGVDEFPYSHFALVGEGIGCVLGV